VPRGLGRRDHSQAKEERQRGQKVNRRGVLAKSQMTCRRGRLYRIYTRRGAWSARRCMCPRPHSYTLDWGVDSACTGAQSPLQHMAADRAPRAVSLAGTTPCRVQNSDHLRASQIALLCTSHNTSKMNRSAVGHRCRSRQGGRGKREVSHVRESQQAKSSVSTAA